MGDSSRFAGAILANGVGQVAYKSASRFQVPLLFITAENDKVVPPEGTEALMSELQSRDADVTLVKYKAAGHNPRQGAGSMYEHISEFLTKFENAPPPTVGDVSDEWPEMGKKLKCFDSESVAIMGIDRVACQEMADSVGHRYIQYLSNEQICATSETCDSAHRFSENWQVFWRPQGLTPSMPRSPSPASPPTPPPPLDLIPVPTAPPPPAALCTTLKSNLLWTETRCQERCGNADKCRSSQSQCAKLCSGACPCGSSEPTPAPVDAPTRVAPSCTTLKPENPLWTQTRCQTRCGNADKCRSSQSQCAKLCSGACPCGSSEPTPAPVDAPTRVAPSCTTLKPENPLWTQIRCQTRCGNADNCRSSQSQCARLCSEGCECSRTRI